MLKRLFKLFVIVISAMMVVWWLNVPLLDGDKPSGPRILVTTPMLQDLVIQLAGPDINVETLIPRTETHESATMRSDLAEKINQSDVVIYNGSSMDGPYETIAKFKQKGVVFININDVISRNRYSTVDYYWMNIMTWTSVSNYVQRRLMAALPEIKSEISYRSLTYQKRLYELSQRMNNYVRKQGAEQQRVGLNHAALVPLFQLMRVEHQLINVPEQPTDDQVNTIIDQLKVSKVASVYPVQSSNQAALEALSKITFNQGWKLQVLPPLMSLTLEKKGRGIDTYLKMMDHNLRVIMGG